MTFTPLKHTVATHCHQKPPGAKDSALFIVCNKKFKEKHSSQCKCISQKLLRPCHSPRLFYLTLKGVKVLSFKGVP